MTSRARSIALLLMAVLCGTASGQTTRQTQVGSSARLIGFTNEPVEPEFGEVFTLRINVRLAPGAIAFFPDTLLPANASFSAGSGNWTVTPGPADSVDVHAAYPVLAVMNGGVELPSLELWTRRAAPGEAAGPKSSSALPAAPLDSSGGFEHAVVYLGGVPIIPLREMAAAEDALIPRPAADVEGGNWAAGVFVALALLGLAAALLAWLLASRADGDAATRADPPAEPELHTRADALRELDRIRELGWHRNGRVIDFYDETTGVLRRYCGRDEPEHGAALTSSELVARLRGRWGDGAVEALGSAVWAAERAKFGSYRPSADAAERDWSTVRAWVESAPEG